MSDLLEVEIDRSTLDEIAEDAAQSILENIGQLIVEEVAGNIGIQGPPRSQEGEYPRRDSGELVESLFYHVEGMTLIVGASADHAEKVEEIRPFMVRTFTEIESDIRNLVS